MIKTKKNLKSEPLVGHHAHLGALLRFLSLSVWFSVTQEDGEEIGLGEGLELELDQLCCRQNSRAPPLSHCQSWPSLTPSRKMVGNRVPTQILRFEENRGGHLICFLF